MALDVLLGEMRSAFGQEYFHKRPFALSGGAKRFTPLGDWDTIAAALASPHCDLLIVREGQQRPQAEPLAPDAARDLFADGWTIVLRHAERCHEGLAALAAEVSAELAGAIDVHLYATPAGRAGFRWHYDVEDVFILQCQGVKEFSLRKNTVNPWPLLATLPADMRYDRESMPLFKCRLEAGDWLYIPNGYWHLAEALEDSISLAVGVLSPTAIDLFDFLRAELQQSLLWRQRLPARTLAESDVDWREQCREIIGRLGVDLRRLFAEDRMIQQFLDRLAADRRDQRRGE